MRILYYNWVDYMDAERRGGGVTLYQLNLINELSTHDDIDPWFLSAGVSYDVLRSAPRFAKVTHGSTWQRDRRYEIVNSGVTAPGHFSFGNPNQISHPATVECFARFLREKGPFDVVHFNSLEGISADVLALKAQFPRTRFVLSLHNYYPLCPQVNLWHQEQAHCDDNDSGRKCVNCVPDLVSEQAVRHAHAAAFLLKRWGIEPGSWMFDRLFGATLRIAKRLLGALRKSRRRQYVMQDVSVAKGTVAHVKRGQLSEIRGAGHPFVRRRSRIVELINTHCDEVLCVSERTQKVARKHGIRPELLKTVYIGTRHAELFDAHRPRRNLLDKKKQLTLAFLGYMRADKGFGFLINALLQMRQSDLSRINLVVAAPMRQGPMMDQLIELSDKLASLRLADGYAQDQLDDILSEVSLGVVPVAWEDNLPQVAIEMHARRIPLLTSNRGGAQELGRYPDLVFNSDDKADFIDTIGDVLAGNFDAEAYWAGAMPPKSMQDHVDELLDIYGFEPSRALAKVAPAQLTHAALT